LKAQKNFIYISLILLFSLSLFICNVSSNHANVYAIASKSQVMTPIIAPASATVVQAQTWAKKKGATQTFINLAPLYWKLSKYSGVDPAVAYAQSAKETKYGKFGGVLNESFHNPCGLKISRGGSNYNAKAHMRFVSWECAILAQLDHLALYAGAAYYPKKVTYDPRHFKYLFGKSKFVEQLGGKWAPAKNYGASIVNDFLKGIRSTKI
jgi:hypothetical protein